MFADKRQHLFALNIDEYFLAYYISLWPPSAFCIVVELKRHGRKLMFFLNED